MIRRARPADAHPLAGLQLRAWARAYADFIPSERLEPEGVAERRRTWEAILAQPAELGRTTLVADQDGQVAGFVSVGPSRDGDARPDAGDLMAVYVDPPAQGAGVGRELMDAGESLLRERGYAEAVLWVFADNGLAREFYERRGWLLDPPEVIAREHGESWWAPALRYRLVLTRESELTRVEPG